ncbi:MAG: hypothetical protein ABSG44_17690 [Thermodesulfobacteriota bacterium]
MRRHNYTAPANPHPPPNSPLKGEEHNDFPPLQGEERVGVGRINNEKIGLENPLKMMEKGGAMISTAEIIALGRRLGLKSSEGCQNYQNDRFGSTILA